MRSKYRPSQQFRVLRQSTWSNKGSAGIRIFLLRSAVQSLQHAHGDFVGRPTAGGAVAHIAQHHNGGVTHRIVTHEGLETGNGTVMSYQRTVCLPGKPVVAGTRIVGL